MQFLPSAQSLRVLLEWSQALEAKRGWVKVDSSQVPGIADLTDEEIQTSVSELTSRGYCTPAAHGDLIYLTGEGAKLAAAVKILVERGAELSELTPEALGPGATRLPFFRLPRSIVKPASPREAVPPVLAS